MAAVESEVRQLVDDASFSAAHAATAHHLGEAQQLLSSATSTAKPVVVEIGDHLRSALQTVIHDVAGGNPERPVPNLSAWALSVAAEREPTILVDMVVHALSCSQRLTHIRDETAHARPLRSLDELRRVVFLTTVVCYEVAALPPTRDRTGDQPDPSTDPGEFTSRRGDLNDLEHGYVVASRADNTIRGYRADWAEWCDWAARNGYCPLPAARCPRIRPGSPLIGDPRCGRPKSAR